MCHTGSLQPMGPGTVNLTSRCLRLFLCQMRIVTSAPKGGDKGLRGLAQDNPSMNNKYCVSVFLDVFKLIFFTFLFLLR